MEQRTSDIDVDKAIMRAVLTAVVHSLLPLALLVHASYIMPRLMVAFTEAGMKLTGSLRFFCRLTTLITEYWYLYLALLGVALTLDGMIYFSLCRSGRKNSEHLWSGFVMLAEVAFVAFMSCSFMAGVVKMTR
jgi:hypothetical protein